MIYSGLHCTAKIPISSSCWLGPIRQQLSDISPLPELLLLKGPTLSKDSPPSWGSRHASADQQRAIVVSHIKTQEEPTTLKNPSSPRPCSVASQGPWRQHRDPASCLAHACLLPLVFSLHPFLLCHSLPLSLPKVLISRVFPNKLSAC